MVGGVPEGKDESTPGGGRPAQDASCQDFSPPRSAGGPLSPVMFIVERSAETRQLSVRWSTWRERYRASAISSIIPEVVHHPCPERQQDVYSYRLNNACRERNSLWTVPGSQRTNTNNEPLPFVLLEKGLECPTLL